MNGTNHSDHTSDNGGQYSTGFLFILPVIFAIIFIGNVLLLAAITSFRARRVPDQLVGSLAAIDLLNDLGPVLMSIVVFRIDRDGFQSEHISYKLCQFYNWSSSFLRLSASFVATLMVLDCVCATLQPIYYRTKVTCDKVAIVISCVVLSAAFTSALPAVGWGKVLPHKGICSFDFGGSYALFIAILGYIQLVMVLTCFIAVARKMSEYENRLGGLRRGRTLTFSNGRLQAIEIQTTKKRRITDIEENGIQGSSSSNELYSTKRVISTLPEEDDGDKHVNVNKRETTSCTESKADPGPHKTRRVNRHIKESRQFTKILGSAVLLFYISWMPIIVSLFLLFFFSFSFELVTKQNVQEIVIFVLEEGLGREGGDGLGDKFYLQLQDFVKVS